MPERRFALQSPVKNIDALVYYSSANQVAAIVPSTTPTGRGTVAVTYNGRTGNAASISVLQNNAGLYTVNSQGTGSAVATFPDYSYVTPANAVNPGEIAILWADGLGPIPTDDAQLPVSADMANVPLEILIGGKTAGVLFRGRSGCCASLDQINVRIPDGVAGCVTPVVLKIGALVSNTATIPIAASGRKCTTNDPSTTDVDFQALIGKNQAAIGQVALLRSTIASFGAGNTIVLTNNDAGSAFFYKYPAPDLFVLSNVVELPPPGSCLMTTGQNPSTSNVAPPKYLDAGAAITLSGPNGVKLYPNSSTPVVATAYFGESLGTRYLDAGTYTVSGPGGPDVGSFSAKITFPKGLVWTNQANMTSVNRANGATVSWTGGADANGLVRISGLASASTSATSSVFARFDCVAKGSDGSFTIPPAVLLALPATGDTLGTLTVGNSYNRVPFSAAGIDHGFIYFGTGGLNLGIVTYR